MEVKAARPVKEVVKLNMPLEGSMQEWHETEGVVKILSSVLEALVSSLSGQVVVYFVVNLSKVVVVLEKVPSPVAVLSG